MEDYRKFMQLLDKIAFVHSFSNISEKYSDFDNGMPSYNIEIVKNIIEKKGYKSSFNAQEKFFHIKEKIGEKKFVLNISLSDGRVAFIISIIKNNIKLLPAGPFSFIASTLNNNKHIINPAFKDYDELEDILIAGFEMYEQIKDKILKASWY